MNLIKSVSGIRGIRKEEKSDSLTNQAIEDCLKDFLSTVNTDNNISLAIGKDGRASSKGIYNFIINFIQAHTNITIYNLEYCSTPTISHFILHNKFILGGIMITASHNQQEWNGLKFFDKKGKSHDISQLNNNNEIIKKKSNSPNRIININNEAVDSHIKSIQDLNFIDINKHIKIAIDGCNSSGALELEKLLKAFGIKGIKKFNSNINGKFSRNPEPTTKNLYDFCNFVKKEKCDIGFATDPDADRLVAITSEGVCIGEELTFAVCLDFLSDHIKTPIVINMSTSLISKETAEKKKVQLFESNVGELNVVRLMEEKGALIGGEGNGGIIFTDICKTRNSLLGIACFLSYLKQKKVLSSEVKNLYPKTYLEKIKVHNENIEKHNKNSSVDKDKINNYTQIKEKLLSNNHFEIYKRIDKIIKIHEINLLDGIKYYFKEGWIHIRKSNTEPVLRIFFETKDQEIYKKINKVLQLYKTMSVD